VQKTERLKAELDERNKGRKKMQSEVERLRNKVRSQQRQIDALLTDLIILVEREEGEVFIPEREYMTISNQAQIFAEQDKKNKGVRLKTLYLSNEIN
jgi:archaellum component FlaC